MRPICFKELDISTAKYKKFNMLCAVICNHVYSTFGICLCSMLMCSNLFQNGHFSFSAYFDGHYCYNSNGLFKIKLIPDF